MRWISLLLLVMLMGCSSPPEDERIVVLTDLTASSQESRNQTLAAFDTILATLHSATQLYVVGIEANSLVSPVELVLTPPQVKGSLFGSNSYTERRGIQQMRAQAAERFRTLVERPAKERQGSAIVDAIVRAQDLLVGFSSGRRTLVVLSDGFEQGDLADFSGLQVLDVAPLLERLKQAGRVPDLTGTCVYFAGITEGDQKSPVSAQTVRAVSSFWRAFFQATGAQLALYDPSLIHFEPGDCAGDGGSSGGGSL